MQSSLNERENNVNEQELLSLNYRYRDSKTVMDCMLQWKNIIPDENNSREVTPNGLLQMMAWIQDQDWDTKSRLWVYPREGSASNARKLNDLTSKSTQLMYFRAQSPIHGRSPSLEILQ